ncbi:MAG: hypothetical protein LC749_02560 [Actinobacteria bacterium]|nr:hypothetical protein [Actinomycetota bacterium]
MRARRTTSRLLGSGHSDETHSHDARSAAVVALRRSQPLAHDTRPAGRRQSWRPSAPATRWAPSRIVDVRSRIVTAVAASKTTVTEV